MSADSGTSPVDEAFDRISKLLGQLRGRARNGVDAASLRDAADKISSTIEGVLVNPLAERIGETFEMITIPTDQPVEKRQYTSRRDLIAAICAQAGTRSQNYIYQIEGAKTGAVSLYSDLTVRFPDGSSEPLEVIVDPLPMPKGIVPPLERPLLPLPLPASAIPDPERDPDEFEAEEGDEHDLEAE